MCSTTIYAVMKFGPPVNSSAGFATFPRQFTVCYCSPDFYKEKYCEVCTYVMFCTWGLVASVFACQTSVHTTRMRANTSNKNHARWRCAVDKSSQTQGPRIRDHLGIGWKKFSQHWQQSSSSSGIVLFPGPTCRLLDAIARQAGCLELCGTSFQAEG